MSLLGFLRGVVGTLLGLGLWLGIKHFCNVPDRYLPGLQSIAQAVTDIGPAWASHILATFSRTVIGSCLGVVVGISLALLLFKLRILSWSLPLVHAVRAVPAVAIVPFFLLWFGFSEVGRYLLVVLGLGLNVLVACADRLEQPRAVDQLLFHNLGLRRNTRIFAYWLPRVLEDLLPTLRFGISLALGMIVVSEMLGAQTGLGYLMQTSRATFSLNVIFLAALALGLIATVLDLALQWLWGRLVTWRT
ncbi:MAG: transporter permease [Caulobacter sp.]|nr:transporter permease [Caulobacter sp.]